MMLDNIEKRLRAELTGQRLLDALKRLDMLKRGVEQERNIRLKLQNKNN